MTPALIGASIVLGIFIGMENNSSYNTNGIDAIIETYSMDVSDVQQIISVE